MLVLKLFINKDKRVMSVQVEKHLFLIFVVEIKLVSNVEKYRPGMRCTLIHKQLFKTGYFYRSRNLHVARTPKLANFM